MILQRSSEGLYLLQRVRDEAHRFAIAQHRRQRSKGMTASALDDVPGLGPARRTALLKHFGSLKRLRGASVEEIASVRGMGERTAQAVVAALGEAPRTAAPRRRRPTTPRPCCPRTPTGPRGTLRRRTRPRPTRDGWHAGA